MDDRHHTLRNSNDASDPTSRGAPGADDDAGEALLSAYLDGECTAAEQAQIEERIAASSELRQLVEELRGVRTSLEHLPQYRLEADFAERVLRRAEREVLVGGGKWTKGSEPSVTVIAPPAPAAASSLPRDHGPSGRARPILWTLAALAAAMLILVTNRDPEMRRDPLAQRSPGTSTTQAKKSAATSATTVGKNDAQSNANGLPFGADDMLPRIESQVDNRSTGAVPPPGSGPQPATYGIRGDGRATELSAGGQAQYEDKQAELGALRRKDGVDKRVVEETIAGDLNDGQAFDRPNPNRTPSNPTADVQHEGVVRAPAAEPPAEKREGDEARLKLKTGAATNTDHEIRPTAPAPALSAGEAGSTRGTAAESAAGVKSGIAREDESAQSSGAVAAKDESAVSFAMPQESLRVVQVWVERDAWQRGAVDEILAKNQIELYDAQPATNAPLGPRATAAPSQPEQTNQQANQEANQPYPATGDGLELLVVSATSAQVEAALGDFGNQDAFQVVNVTDASAPAQLLGQSLQKQTNRFSKTIDRGGQLSAPTSKVPNDRLDALDIDSKRDTAKVEEPFGQLANEADAKKLSQGISPDGKKPAASLFLEQKIAGGSEKSREMRDAPARTRRIQTAPNGTAEARKENADAGAGALSGAVGRGLAQPDVPNKDQAAGLGGYGYGGGRGGAAPADRSRYGGSSLGSSGMGGGGFGGAIAADVGTTNTPRGYAQRVTIQQSAEDHRKQNASVLQFGTSPDGARSADEAPSANALAPEQVLFLFRVVDTPLVKANLERGQSTSASSSPARRAQADAAEQGERTGAPVPAPAPAGGSPR